MIVNKQLVNYLEKLVYLWHTDRDHACLSNVAKYPSLRQLVPSHDYVISEKCKQTAAKSQTDIELKIYLVNQSFLSEMQQK